MRVLIDLQGLQPLLDAAMPHRSYAVTLTKQLARRLRDRGHQVILLLDGRFSDDIESAREAFAGSVDAEDFRTWSPHAHALPRNELSINALRCLYEAFVARDQPDVLYVASLPGEGRQSEYMSSGRLAQQKTAIAFHDLTWLNLSPLDIDSPDASIDLRVLRGADLFITTSEWARRRIVDSIGTDAPCLVVLPDVGDEFAAARISHVRGGELLAQCGLFKPFVIFPLLTAHPRSVEHAIEAFMLLPAMLRAEYQLVIAHAQPQEVVVPLIAALTLQHGLTEDDVVAVAAAGSAERADLYGCSALVVAMHCDTDAFCFPALEAMRCGAPLIATDHSSLPEILVDRNAVVDAASPFAMASKITQVLTSATFRNALSRSGAERAADFAMEDAVLRIVEGLEGLASAPGAPKTSDAIGCRPKLAYVSPLPPERSGISDYSAKLVPELAKHYDIELITRLERIEDPALANSFPKRDCTYFLRHAESYDRVLYHMGNSPFHEHMFDLLSLVPGTVVLHDFFLGDVQAHLEFRAGKPHAWTKELYRSHGYGAVIERLKAESPSKFVGLYPCSFGVIGRANGIIVHSSYSTALAEHWHGRAVGAEFMEIPLLRCPSPSPSAERRREARKQLGFADDDFVVCSFGLLGRTKQNDRLLRAWKASTLTLSPRCKLVFVGENGSGPYGAQVQDHVDSIPNRQAVITGWASSTVFELYLESADLAVQLRTESRGEVSAAALDAMNYGIPTIVNGHGSMALLPDDAVWMLDEEFTDEQLVDALDQLWRDSKKRKELSLRARSYIADQHSPPACAERYALAIEQFAAKSQSSRDGLLKRLKEYLKISPTGGPAVIAALAQTISETLPPRQPAKQLFLDISGVVEHDLHTGIQRVVKSLLRALVDAPPAGFRIEPVYALPGRLGYRYARKFTLRLLGGPEDALEDESISFVSGDQFVGVDLLHDPIPFQAPYLRRMRSAGVGVHFVVYDMLPVLLPHRFPPSSSHLHARWLHIITSFDSALCISNAVAGELDAWLEQHAPERRRQGFKIRAFHLGADLGVGGTNGLPPDAPITLASIATGTSFLMVGTVEPRKGHALALEAFERLWQAGHAVNLVIVGKQGWMMEEIAHRLRSHPERDHRLFWLEGASDEYLEKVYAASTCLLAASEGEGFGLPLIEGAQHGLPILARDLPVFREVAGKHAFYFAGNSAALAGAVAQWANLKRRGRHPRSDGLRHLRWSESAEQFIAALLGDEHPAAKPAGTKVVSPASSSDAGSAQKRPDDVLEAALTSAMSRATESSTAG